MKKKLSIGSWPTSSIRKAHQRFPPGRAYAGRPWYDGVELGAFGVHPTPVSHPTRADRQRLKKEVADHGLEFSGIAVDLWSFKKPGPSIMDENPTPYVLHSWVHVFGADLGIKTIRVDAVEPPDFFATSKMDPKVGQARIIDVWSKCSKMAATMG